MTTTSLFLSSRFNGPPGVANGGIACGSLAGAAGVAPGAAVEVRLRRPVPLDRRLDVRLDGDAFRLEDAGEVVARGHVTEAGPDLSVPDVVTADEAVAATRRHTNAVFPACFVCGSGRPDGDGLRIFPGRVADRRVWAAPWTPDRSVVGADGRVAPEFVWAALDCPAGFAAVEDALERDALPGGSAAVLGRMSVRLAGLPEIAVEHRIVAWPIAVDGRRLTAGSALLSPNGDVLAAAGTTWVALTASAPQLDAGRVR
ncbi:hypothetical protein [Pseudonocardia sp. GCM10023141]|uniref:hypothetical protein n=1 Tax=Pseudonocardia sp. GCM10023141 TaxID=3252653 RepID=UPI0036212B7F